MATLNKLFTSLLLFGLAVNIIIYLFNAFHFNPLHQTEFMDLTQWQNWFAPSVVNIAIFGGSAAAITVVSLLFRQGTYALYALLIAMLGIIIRPVGDIVLAVPNAIGNWLPPESNPLAYTNGVYNPASTAINPITVVIGLIYAFAAFWFLFGVVLQRDVS